MNKELWLVVVTRKSLYGKESYMREFLKNALKTSAKFLRTVFSFGFWKEAGAAVVIAGATAAVKAFLETSTNVGSGIMKGLYRDTYQRHKLDRNQDELMYGDHNDMLSGGDVYEYEGAEYDDAQYEDPEVIKQRNLKALADKYAQTNTPRPVANESKDVNTYDSTHIPDPADAAGEPLFDDDDDDFFDEPDDITAEVIDVTDRTGKTVVNGEKYQDPEWDGAKEIIGNIAIG